MTKIGNTIRSIFLSGLLTVLPITLTVALAIISYNVVRSWLKPVTYIEPTFIKKIPGSEILVVLLFIFCIGLVLRLFLLAPIVSFIETLLGKIPLIRQIYFGFKKLVHAFGAHDKLSFQNVVFVEFPRAGVYSIGFMTSEIESHIVPMVQEKYYSVFIPTTPNPTTGFYILVPARDCIISDLSRQEAMAMIISGGIIQPKNTTTTT